MVTRWWKCEGGVVRQSLPWVPDGKTLSWGSVILFQAAHNPCISKVGWAWGEGDKEFFTRIYS